MKYMRNPHFVHTREILLESQHGYSWSGLRAGLRRFGWLAACLLFAFALAAPSLLAQVQNGTIQGVVTDSAKAVLPNANVTVRQVATNLVFHDQTDGTGLYRLPQLLPGEYTVTVDREGFK